MSGVQMGFCVVADYCAEQQRFGGEWLQRYFKHKAFTHRIHVCNGCERFNTTTSVQWMCATMDVCNGCKRFNKTSVVIFYQTSHTTAPTRQAAQRTRLPFAREHLITPFRPLCVCVRVLGRSAHVQPECDIVDTHLA